MARPQHGFNQDPTKPWRVEAGRYFSRGRNNKLTWPGRINMVSEQHKVLYTPIAKCACTSLKTMMVRLARLPHYEHILRLGVHRVTDEFNTGMHLKDLSDSRAAEIADGVDYYSFAVLRDPLKRIISAYTDKFLATRHGDTNALHTGRVIRAVQNTSNPDRDRGITFRQFVDYIVSQAPANLDPHWAPQYFSLQGVSAYNRIFRVDQLPELKRALEDWTGAKIQLGQLNTSIAPADTSEPVEVGPGGAVDLYPPELEALAQLDSRFFLDPALVAAIERYYAEDFELYRTRADSGGPYIPPALDYGKPATPGPVFPSRAESNTWNRVNLYSKGYFGLHPDGQGSTGIAIVNASRTTVDAQLFPGLRIETRLLDGRQQTLEGTHSVHPIPKALPPQDCLQMNIEVSVPPELQLAASRLQINLVADADERDLQNNLAHSATAEIIRLGS